MTSTAGRTLSGADLVFAQRMLPHFLSGKTAIEAAALILQDDERLFQAFAMQSSHCVHSTAVEPRNEGIRSELGCHVYRRLAAAKTGGA